MKCKICELGLGQQVDELYKANYTELAICKELKAKGYNVITQSVAKHIEHNNFGAEIIQKETATIVQKKDVTIPDKVQEYLNMDVDTTQLTPYQKARLQATWAKIGLEGMGLETELKLLRAAMHDIIAKAGQNET